jgi:Tfp pilus assembly protein PilO
MQIKIGIIKEKLKNQQILQGLSREKKILAIILLILVGFLLYQSLLASQFLRLKATDFQFSSLRKLFNFYNRLLNRTDVLVTETKEKERDMRRIRKSFIDEEELPNYFTDLRSMVKSQNLTIASLDFKPQELVKDAKGKALEYVKMLPLDISLKGNYFNLMSLLHKLENSAPIFEIKSVHLKQENPASYEVSMYVTSAIYILSKGNQR